VTTLATRTFFCLLLLASAAVPAAAQLQLAAVRGVVTAEDGVLPGATVELADPLGGRIDSRITGADGRFAFPAVAPGRYLLRASLPGFKAADHAITVDTSLPLEVTLRLALHGVIEVFVDEAGLPDSPAARASIAGASIAQVPVRSVARGVQEVVATLPGWATEDNGLLHVRGVDDGFLYVLDGVPVYERLDSLNGIGPDLANVESINVFTGYIPAEFGYKAGGVIDVQSLSTGKDWPEIFQVERGSDDTTAANGLIGWRFARAFVATVSAHAQESNRFLDPVHPDNFHNHGSGGGAESQLTWQSSDSDFLRASAAVGRLDFDVPNTEAQAIASQDQRQTVRRSFATVSWQHLLSSSAWLQLAGYVRQSSARLVGSAFDTPVFADANRTLSRAGAIAGISRRINSHTVKAGFEIQRLALNESFMFSVTDPEAAEEAGLSDAAIEHDEDDPFLFSGRDTPLMWSLFVQDEWLATDRLTLSGGVRIDESRLGIERRQVSPRAGAAYRAAAGTVLRGSVSRFFQPPQPENLLLSTSDEAWELSPFAEDGAEGGADLEPERQWAFEAGISQQLGTLFRLDAAIWKRSIVQAADPNVFGGTTIIFPNAVAKGRAAGADLRLEMPKRGAWSGYVNLAIGSVRQNGPITGGLFLEDDVAEVASGEEFIPDHDQLIVAGGGATWTHSRSGASVSAAVRYESGTPLERSEEDEDELRERPGAEMVDFDRGRVAPRTVASLLADVPIWKRGRRSASIRAAVLNLFDDRYAYNFGNPFSGTHFGSPRTASLAARIRF
jgi:outer membrane receptor protein involved in Fe transport